MKETTCPDCGTVYAVNMQSCPTCGCPNDNYQQQDEQQPEVPEQSGNSGGILNDSNPQQDEQQPGASKQGVNGFLDDYNENGQYSPISPTSWLFVTPWPLDVYPERKMFEKEHPFLGWLFGPWYLTCKSKNEKEEYDVINNIFYFLNLIFKTLLYSVLWAFFKGWFVILIWLFFLFLGYKAVENGSDVVAAAVLVFVCNWGVGLFFAVVECCGMGKALHRYWPSIHQTWRRIEKRYWNAMLNQK